jgi:hypothetical protein
VVSRNRTDRDGLTYLPFALMDQKRRKIFAMKGSTPDGTQMGGKLEWCKVFSFNEVDDSLSLQWKTIYYDGGTQGDGSAEYNHPIALPPMRDAPYSSKPSLKNRRET